MTALQEVRTVKAKVYPERVADVIEWECLECGQNQKQYTYHIKDINEVHCERCGETFVLDR